MTILTRVSATLLAATCLAGAAAAQTELTFWQHGAGNPWEPRIFGQIVEDFNASQSDWQGDRLKRMGIPARDLL